MTKHKTRKEKCTCHFRSYKWQGFIVCISFSVLTKGTAFRSAGIPNKTNKTTYSCNTWIIIRNAGKLLTEFVHIRFPPVLKEDLDQHRYACCFVWTFEMNLLLYHPKLWALLLQIPTLIVRYSQGRESKLANFWGTRIISFFSVCSVRKQDTGSCSMTEVFRFEINMCKQDC